MTTARISRISAKSLFLEQENVSYIHDAIRSGGRIRISAADMSAWYDNFMKTNRIEVDKIEDVQVWADFMTEGFIREFRGKHSVTSEDVPYLPFDDPMGMAEMPENKAMISKPRKDGRFPKFNLPSAVEDGVGYDGRPVIHEEHQRIRMFQPLTKNGGYNDGWRFGKKNPLVAKRIAGHRGALNDAADIGSLYEFELVGRKHTPYPMEKFFTRDHF
jgi:hypothetical protein